MENIVKKNTSILLGSVKTHSCDPTMDCKECHGTGTCQECRGSGETKCESCGGNGRCRKCNGRGHWRCNECGGSGNCRRCHGSGDVECELCHGTGTYRSGNNSRKCPKCGGSGSTPCKECRSGLQTAVKALDALTFGAGATYGHGSGKCSKCGGSGEIVCKECDGSGLCTDCSGKGTVTCGNCDGSGDCPKCDNGQVTCTRCEGSGSYQTFLKQTSTLYAKRWRWAGSSPYRDLVATSCGANIYGGPVKTWADSRNMSSDEEAAVHKVCMDNMGEESQLFEEFLTASATATQVLSPENHQDKPYSKSLVAQRVPVTEINYTINDENYQMVIVGNNNLVAVKHIPTVIKGYELTLWKKIKLALTYKRRLKAFACLAAYIFQCDGKSPEESKVLNAMVDELHLSTSAKEKFIKKLNTLNTRLPYKQFRKIIKPLFSSKKTITYAWQCMAVDKKITPEEQELFDQIVAEYKLTPEEVKRLQSAANKFSRLKDDQIAKEYGDLSDSMSQLRKKIYKITGGVLCFLILVGGIIFYVKSLPDEQPAEKQLPASASYEETLADVEKTVDDAIKEINSVYAENVGDAESTQPEEDTQSSPEEPVELRLNGAVGKYPVKMELTIDVSGEALWGSYSYTKTGHGEIPLKGRIIETTEDESKGKTIHALLYELDNNGNAAGELDLHIPLSDASKVVEGSYTSTTGKVYPINLSEAD